MPSPQRIRYVTPQESLALRKAAGLSQRTAGALFGVSAARICNWEKGRRETPKWAVMLYRILVAKRQALITGRAPAVEIGDEG